MLAVALVQMDLLHSKEPEAIFCCGWGYIVWGGYIVPIRYNVALRSNINKYPKKLAGPIKDIEVHDNLLYVSSIEGVSIYQITAAKQLQKLTTIDRISLQGTPYALSVVGDSLWVALTDSRRIIEVELVSGEYRIVRNFSTVDTGGNRFKPRDILIKDNLILVSSGSNGSVVLYQEDSAKTAVPVASLKLAYLVRNGSIYAGQMILQGKLYT